MSEENIEIVRACIDALNRHDWAGVLKYAAPEFELDMSRAIGPDRGVYDLGQVVGFWEGFTRNWESRRFEAHEFIDAGEHVVVPVTLHARGRDGIEVTARVTQLWTIRDGGLLRMTMYQERQEALEAAGLSE